MSIEIDCDTCNDGGYTCTVSVGSPDVGPHHSEYACDECVPVRVFNVMSTSPKLAGTINVKALPGRTAHIPPLPMPTGPTTSDASWWECLGNAAYFWHSYVSASSLGAQAGAFERLSNAMSDLQTYHPDYDMHTGRCWEEED